MKYYVNSGNMQVIVNADTPKDAVKKAVETTKADQFGMIVEISEVGFDSNNPNDLYMLMPTVLHEMDLMDTEDYEAFIAMLDQGFEDGLE